MNQRAPVPLQPACDTAVLIGFSGGLDSTALLHLLAADPAQRARGLRAIHVHHGLQPQADGWVVHCKELCQALDVPLHVVRVQVPDDTGSGPEAAARSARHAAFAEALARDEWLALAHHQDDQAETFLLRALRGSGVDGLGAMRPLRPFAAGMLWRPLLSVPRSELQDYARAHGLEWIEDPSNAEDAADRNFLRLQVMPLVAKRWPHAAQALARSAALAGEAAAQLATQHDQDLVQCLAGDALSLPTLLALPTERRAGVLRELDTPPRPAATASQRSARHRAGAAAGRARPPGRLPLGPGRSPALARPAPCITGPGAVATALAHHLGWPRATGPARRRPVTTGGQPRFRAPAAGACAPWRRAHHPPGRSHSHALKDLLQQADFPPWLRTAMPLLCDGEEVLAAGDRIISARLHDWLQRHGARLHWQTATSCD
jgi:tRNA(Ile)-lysidine synthetase, N-terminal domain/tRNA(Ile)-lysidine synthetase, C-terminal domain